MSGTVGLRARKQWQIQGGPRGTLRRLRNQLAEDGCVESQVVIAKHLLKEAQDGGDWTETTAQAVHWLMKASEYGNDEATTLLRSCFRSGAGITEENIAEVNACLNMSQDEKLFRMAARDLFNTLTPFGQEFVTTNQLQARARGDRTLPDNLSPVDSSKNEAETKKDVVDSSFIKWYEDAGIFDGQHLTEDKLAEAAAMVSNGKLPSVSLEDDAFKTSRKSTAFTKKVFTKLKQGVSTSSTKALDWIARYGDRFLLSILPWNQLRTFALLLLCTLLPSETIFYILPLIAFYVSLAVMLISTLQILRNRKRFATFMLWLQIFRSTNCDLQTHCAEGKFCYRRLRPYARYFVALFVFLAAFPMASTKSVPHSELVALFAGLAMLCLVGFNVFTPQIWVFAITSSLLTAIRVIHTLGLSDGTAAHFLFLGTKVGLTNRLVFNAALASIPAGVLLFVCFWMAGTESWHGSYKVLLPNTVVLSWMQLIVIFIPYASPSGVLRGAFLWGSAFILPVIFAVAAVFTLVYMVSWLANFIYGTMNPLHLLTTLVCLAATAAGKFILERRKKLIQSIWRKWLMGVQIMCGIFAILQLLPTIRNLEFGTSDSKSGSAVIDWQTYHGLCHTPAWKELTMANVQEDCTHLVGASIEWSGQVKTVKIVKIQNKLEEILEFLPATISKWLRCVYGVPYRECDHDEMSEQEYRVCSIIKLVGRHKCHVKQWNLHDFEVSIQMSGGYWNSADIILVADNSFKDFIFHLNAGDEIQFTGLLHANVGGWQPRIWLKTVSCENCVYGMEPAIGQKQVDLNDEFHKICNFVFNFFFYPFMELKREEALT